MRKKDALALIESQSTSTEKLKVKNQHTSACVLGLSLLALLLTLTIIGYVSTYLMASISENVKKMTYSPSGTSTFPPSPLLTHTPSANPTIAPSTVPSHSPSATPSETPSLNPTIDPTTESPTFHPTINYRLRAETICEQKPTEKFQLMYCTEDDFLALCLHSGFVSFALFCDECPCPHSFFTPVESLGNICSQTSCISCDNDKCK
eukprot:snap_masked-scaffold_75-processed-gene-0.39-mRNA-1 protein AED:1.00 eAED:1.00 QI:0/-1/0/0/-1/1/1/0/205